MASSRSRYLKREESQNRPISSFGDKRVVLLKEAVETKARTAVKILSDSKNTWRGTEFVYFPV